MTDEPAEVLDVDPELIARRDAMVASLHWRPLAACKGDDPEIFFPGRGEDLHAPVAVCGRCSVRLACLEYALSAGEHFGVWGGMSERERRRIRRDRRQGDVT